MRIVHIAIQSYLGFGQNHMYTMYIRHCWQGNHQIYGQKQSICKVLANPTSRCLPEMEQQRHSAPGAVFLGLWRHQPELLRGAEAALYAGWPCQGTHVCVCVYVFVCAFVCLYVFACLPLCMCVLVCMHDNTYVCMRNNTYAWQYIYVC